MTFKNIQDRVMARVNLTSVEARARIKDEVNERYHKLLGSVGLGAPRFVSSTFNTVNGTYTTTLTLSKLNNLVYVAGGLVLEERTMQQIRAMDPNNTQTGSPQMYAVEVHGASTIVVYVWPKPNAVYVVQYDGQARVTDLSADGDIPIFPEDFHDVLVFGTLADELIKLEKKGLADDMELKAEQRVRELRYFIAKSAYLHQQQGSESQEGQLGPFFGYYGWLP